MAEDYSDDSLTHFLNEPSPENAVAAINEYNPDDLERFAEGLYALGEVLDASYELEATENYYDAVQEQFGDEDIDALRELRAGGE